MIYECFKSISTDHSSILRILILTIKHLQYRLLLVTIQLNSTSNPQLSKEFQNHKRKFFQSNKKVTENDTKKYAK